MKHVLSIKIVTALMMALVPLLLWADNSISYTATYDYSKLTLGTDTLGGVTYTTVSYEGLYNDGAPGAPSLPVDVIRFSVPYNAVNFSVSAKLSNTTTTRIDHMVYPCQLPRMMNDTTPVVITWPDSAAYAPDPDPLHPSPRAWVVDEGFMAGENHIVTVAVLPIANYHSDNGLVRNAIKKTSTVRLTISYELTDPSNVNCLVRSNDSLRQEGYALTRRMVVNGESVETYAPHNVAIYNYPSIEGGTGGNIEIANYPYLIVTTSELLHSVRRIAALKRQKGYDVKVVTLDEVVNDPRVSNGDVIRRDGTSYVAFDDDAGKLRQYLKLAYQIWGTKYVLLAGKEIPYRTFTINSLDRLHGDWYYSELNSDWNTTDPDSIGRETDLYVGRLLALQSDKIDNYTDKLFRYELNPGGGDLSYLNRALYTAGKEFASLIESISYIIRFNLGITTRIMKENNENTSLSGCDVIDSINTNHYGLMFSFNHGAPSCIRISGNDSVPPLHYLWAIDTINMIPSSFAQETGNGLNCMLNKNHPFVYYSLCCETMPYYKLPDYDIDLNFGESFTLGKDYGGPIYLGNTTNVETHYVNILGASFANRISIDNLYILGEADAVSKLYLNDNIYDDKIEQLTLIIGHNLLGDPSVELWTDLPQEYSNISVIRSDHAISVTGISDVDSTIVVYVDNSGNVWKQLASSSTTFNNVSPNGSIMLYKHNYIPYITPLLLQNENLSKSQYVIANDVTAGYSIDSGRTSGDVTITSGVEYEIEASGTVRLEGGFNVEKGATFIVNPSCF